MLHTRTPSITSQPETARATDNHGASAVSTAVTTTVNALPFIHLTSPANGATYTAPAAITLEASAADSDGAIKQVEFFVNGGSIGTASIAPYSVTIAGLEPGSYTLTAVATDDLGGVVVSSPVVVTVTSAAAQIYFIHADHLNTPRVITNQVGQLVWVWANDDPFGANAPNENPTGQGDFICNLRLPGQYFDKESNTYYNYFRDYDPIIGRYIQSDPIGLRGGNNTYLYAYDPLTQIDLFGLMGRSAGGGKSMLGPARFGGGGSPSKPSSRPPVRPDGQPWGWGCGDKDTDHIIPDTLGGGLFNFISACHRHDECYDACNTSKTRCDLDFYADAVVACRGNSSCEQAAMGYFLGLFLGGHRAYNRAQAVACKVCK